MRHTILSLPFFISACAFGSQSFDEVAPDAIPAVVTYNEHIQPIMSFYCTSCHGEGRTFDIDLTNEGELLDECDDVGEQVRSGEMPPGGARRLTSLDDALLSQWIGQGCAP
jgi:hypothetical protein